MKCKKVAIIMGSESDLKIMSEAIEVLKIFKIPFLVEIVSAHRTPKKMYQFAESAIQKNIGIIIAGAGGAAHLPGMVASLTTLPVIGVPVTIGNLKGLDALLSIAQMPKGIPVATVAVDNAFNAGLLAVRMLGIEDIKIAKKLSTYNKELEQKVKKMNQKIKKK